MQPYGDIGIEKLECVGYVEKWTGTRLRALKLKMKARAMETADRERLRKANYDILQNSKRARVKKRHKKCTLEDTKTEERKNPNYGSYYALITICRIYYPQSDTRAAGDKSRNFKSWSSDEDDA
ncbi:hypothetical protein TNCV_2853321 [Trichonephila clavipes]|uniref:Uncharacterized protein n=1 Tax=Trichonephila clavipes TaxID=2585209 RepID=A0A8X6RAN8_TRICX|nr:hypothetical protein TNCV_2853321 [Trichonephila clavipes]